MSFKKSVLVFILIPFCSLAQAETDNQATVFGLRLSPVVAIGMFWVEAPLRVNQHLAIGPVIQYVDMDIGATQMSKTFGLGARVDWHFDEVFQDGFYLSAIASYAMNDSSETLNNKVYRAKTKGTEVFFYAGYLWRWRHLTINLGAGLFYAFSPLVYKTDAGEVLQQPDNIDRLYVPDDKLQFLPDFSFGWAF